MIPGSLQAGSLLPLVVLVPLLGAAAGLIRPARRWISGLAVGATGLTLAGVATLIPAVRAAGRLSWSVPALAGHIELAADAFSVIFALLGSFVWFCATLYSTAYLRDAAGRFQVTSLVVLAAYLGVVLAGDLLTLYVSFELLGLVALVLILHDGTDTARRAGIKYFWMTIGGGVALLAGILLVHAAAGSGAIAPLPPGAGSLLLNRTAFGLLLVGFGVKAGMVPLHVWLPDAHPAAPAPASAMLSGVMIKAGAYGVFRTLNTLFGAGSGIDIDWPAWNQAAELGMVVLWFGIGTMLIGVVLALGQHHAKRMLAWHSVSQMGFVLTGLGAGAWLGPEGAMGTAGGVMHAVNHALFKACLFLGMGAVALRAGTADMYRLGGLWRTMPVTFACMLVAAAGITGLPLFNGFVSKCMIHHALLEGAAREGGGALVVAEWLYLLTCAGTVASFAKLLWLVFIRAPATEGVPASRRTPYPMSSAMILLSLPILALGLRPQLVLEGLIVPGLNAMAIPAEPVDHYLDAYFLRGPDLAALAGTFATGLAIVLIGTRFSLFRLAAPPWVGVDYWYRRGTLAFLQACRTAAECTTAAKARATRRFENARRRGKVPPTAGEPSVEGRHRLGRHWPELERLAPPLHAGTRYLARDPGLGVALAFALLLAFLVLLFQAPPGN